MGETMTLPDGRLKEILRTYYFDFTQRRWTDALFDGYAETIGHFDAVAAEGQKLQAHGMTKDIPSTATAKLIALFKDGIDSDTTNGRRGYLMTAPLILPNGAAHSSQTANGTAYRDGTFILVAHSTLDHNAPGITKAEDIAGVLVNQSIVNHAPDVIQELQKALPTYVMVRGYKDVADIVAHANNPNTAYRAIPAKAPIPDDDAPAPYPGM